MFKKVGKPVNFETYPLKLVYTNGLLPITKKKMEDLLFYCNRNLIPPEHQDFFRTLPSQEEDNNNDMDDETILMAGTGTRRARKRKGRQPVSKNNKRRALTKDINETEDEENDLLDEELVLSDLNIYARLKFTQTVSLIDYLSLVPVF